MIKGITLGICIATLVASFIFIVTGVSGILKENIITGNVLGPTSITAYAFITLILSLIIGLFTLIKIKKSSHLELI